MKYSVLIRKNDTGEERTYLMDEIEWDEASVFWWTDGNYGCDCNRFLCFERAGGADPELESAECGNDAYSVPYATLEDGTRVEIDGLPERTSGE